MRLIFLGTGDAFCVEENNFHSNLLIETSDKKRLLIDCGSDIGRSLHKLNLTYQDVDHVYISHLHPDHRGGLEWLGFSHYFVVKNNLKPRLYIAEDLVDDLWKKSLSGGMSSLSDRPAKLTDFFDVHSVAGSPPRFACHGIEYQLIKTCHVYDDKKLLPTYGLFISTGKKKLLFTGDTQFRPDIFLPYYQEADIILHECETMQPPSSVHTNYSQLLKLDRSIRQKMWLYHYQVNPQYNAQQDGFLGFAQAGQILSLE